MKNLEINPARNTSDIRKIVQSIRHKAQLFNASPVNLRQLSKKVLNKLPSKLNTFHSKRTSPLPPLSSSIDSHFENYLSVSIDGCFKNKVYLKKTRNHSHRPSDSLNFCLETISNNTKKTLQKSEGLKGPEKSKVNPGTTIREKLGNNPRLKDQKEETESKKKSFKECDVQTNDLDYNFHLIYNDEGQVDQLALQQLRLVHLYENLRRFK